MLWMIMTGLGLSTAGKVMLGIAVIRVHSHVAKEHKIDMDVVQAIQREKKIGLFAIFLVLIGFLFEFLFYALPTIT